MNNREDGFDKEAAEKCGKAQERSRREEKDQDKKVNLDTIMVEELGEFGCFQTRVLVLCLLVVLLGGYSGNEYVFTAARIPTRCAIPECDTDSEFSPSWLPIAIPSDGGTFDNCNRFNSTGHMFLNETCLPAAFDRDAIIPCEEYIYEHTDTVVYAFDLACQEWRRSLIGSVSTFGKVLALPLTGFVADRYGRRLALVLNVFSACLGVGRYWATTYASFVALQYFEAALGPAMFMCSLTLVMEYMAPRYRVAAGATMSTFLALGTCLQALVAWAVPNWRLLTLTLYIPHLFIVLYYWILPESARWYLSKGRYAEGEAQLKEAARINGKTLSEKSIQNIKEMADEQRQKMEFMKEKKKKEPWLITIVFQHKLILLRCCIAPVWWFTTMLVSYGLSMNAVTMSGNMYVNYAAVNAVEIPGYWTAVLLFDRIGRKPLLFCAYWMCAACQIAFIFTSRDYFELSLLVYLVGKYSISIVRTGVHIYTTELFPTRYRASLFSFAAMVGRLGAILAPLTPALGTMVYEHLPFILFGVMAALSGTLVLLPPETKGTPLPDTMQQAADIGAKSKQSTRINK